MTDVTETAAPSWTGGQQAADDRSERASTTVDVTSARTTIPEPRQYVLIAIVLVRPHRLRGRGLVPRHDVNTNIVIVVLASMAAMKFFLVVRVVHAHEARTSPFFRRMFIIGIIARDDRLRHRDARVIVEHRPEVGS